MAGAQESDSREGGEGFDLQLDEEEEKQARDLSADRAEVVHEAIRLEGEGELRRPSSALAFSGLAAGLSMGFSLVAEGLLRSNLPDAPWRPLVSKLGYTVGYLIVVLGRQQLFTENTLTVILPLMARRNMATLLQVMRLWAVVLAANLVGALAFAVVVGHTPVFEADLRRTFAEIGREAMDGGGFTGILLKGVFAGWLIALMVWLLPAADSSRVAVIVLITYLVGLAKLTHVIAGSVEALYFVTTGGATWGAYLAYLAPTLLGNILGGVTLVAALNHAQVVAGKDSEGK